jgi:hypothetical protein
MKMREPSLLQRGAVYSLTTIPFGNEASFDGSSTSDFTPVDPASVQASSVFSLCFMSCGFSPLSTARLLPSSLHASWSYSSGALFSSRVSPVPRDIR